MFKIITRSLATAASAAIKKPTIADVTIIGAGPAGLSLGTALKNSPITNHLNIKIIESLNLSNTLENFYNETPDNMTNRVVSLTPLTIKFMQDIGSWELMKQDRIQSYDEMVVIDGVSDAKLEFQHDDIATMAETINIQSSLYQRMKDFEGIEIIDKTKVVDIKESEEHQWPELLLDNGESIKTRLLVGCDGANSPVRKFAQIEKGGWAYNKWGVVLTLTNEYESFKLPTAWQRFLPQGPILLLPLPNNQSTLVWSTTTEISNALLKVSESCFMKLINAAFRFDQDELNFLYDMLLTENPDLERSLDWRFEQFAKNKSLEQLDSFPIPVLDMVKNSRAKFPLRLSHADTYVAPRIALVGDAAHTVHPLAGQGLNLGQLDVASLTEALEKGVERGLDIGSMLCLEPYFSDRYPQNHVMLGICDKLHKVYSNDLWPVVLGRTIGVNILNQLSFVKNFMIQNVSKK